VLKKVAGGVAAWGFQHACTVNMMLAGGGDYVSVKVYSNGKTQVPPCPGCHPLV
jgi:hypothetical protein